jgi:hypothetical protein
MRGTTPSNPPPFQTGSECGELVVDLPPYRAGRWDGSENRLGWIVLC